MFWRWAKCVVWCFSECPHQHGQLAPRRMQRQFVHNCERLKPQLPLLGTHEHGSVCKKEVDVVCFVCTQAPHEIEQLYEVWLIHVYIQFVAHFRSDGLELNAPRNCGSQTRARPPLISSTATAVSSDVWIVILVVSIHRQVLHIHDHDDMPIAPEENAVVK